MEKVQVEKVVAYCRVSSDKQVINGNGLDTQQRMCEAWAKQNGCKIEHFYIDAAKTGTKTIGRDSLDNMLKFLLSTKEPHIALFCDVSRLARNAIDALKLRESILRKGHKLATCKDGIIDDTDWDYFGFGIQALQADVFARQNRNRTIDGMKETARNGYWITQPPKGYKFVKVGTRKELQRDEPLAGIIQSALEQFATAKLVSQTDVANFLSEQLRLNGLPLPRNIFDYVKRILTDRKYTGIFAYPKYDIPTQKWHIEPLISTETFELIQDRLRGRNRLKHKTYNKHDERFPLKGFVTCPECGRPLTASMTKGGKYPYYQCQNRKCPKKKLANVSPQILHAEFENEILNKIAPKESLIALTRELVTKEYEERNKAAIAENNNKKKRISVIEQEQANIADAYIGANDVMKKSLNAKIDALEAEKLNLQNDVNNFTPELMPFDTSLDYVIDFISHPIDVWRNSDYNMKQAVLNLCFSDRISYNKEQKFGTPHLSPIFGLFNTFSGDNSLMVP